MIRIYAFEFVKYKCQKTEQYTEKKDIYIYASSRQKKFWVLLCNIWIHETFTKGGLG